MLSQPTILELYTNHYDGLAESVKPHFLYKLRVEAFDFGNADALEAFRLLAHRWADESAK